MRHRGTLLTGGTVVLLLGATVPGTDAKAARAQLFVVQAVPGSTYHVEIAGGPQRDGVGVGTVLGPFELAAGEHEVRFDEQGGSSQAVTVRLPPGSSTDLVVHLPAAVDGEPVVDVYHEPTGPIGPGKARLLLAHTATVPPADVQVDGTTVFTNIANGEFAEADVPAGAHTAALFPTGATTDPILGPLDVDLPVGTLTLIYAVGTPEDGSMNVISHRVPLPADGSDPPGRVDTGSAGLARLHLGT